MKNSVKKMMKKSAVTLLCLTVLLSLLSGIAASGQELWQERSSEELWAKKYEAEGEMVRTGLMEGMIPLCPFMGNDLTVLLYTDAFDSLTFERRLFENVQAPQGAFWQIPCERETLYLPTVYQGYRGGTSYIFSEQLSEILDRRCIEIKDGERTQVLPYLRGCIEEFGITKEELLAAYALSRSDPDAIREKLSMFTDEEFEQMKSRGLLTCIPENDYIVDALYLPDEADVTALCLYPFAALVDGQIVTLAELMHDGNGAVAAYLMTSDIQNPGFARFLENAFLAAEEFEYLQNGAGAQLYSLQNAMLEPLDDFDDDPPQTGDNTALYLFILVGAAAALALSVRRIKKNENDL